MSKVVLDVKFQIGVPDNANVIPICRESSLTSLVVDKYFQIGLPVCTNFPIQREFLIIESMLQAKVEIGVPENSLVKGIKRDFLPGGFSTQVNFRIGVPQKADTKELWRFPKWTIDPNLSQEKYYILRSIEKPFITIDPLPILPKLRGQAYPETKRPEYNIIHKESASAIAKTYETWQFPRWYIDLVYEFLDGNAEGSDFRRLLDFFIARRGQLEDFWYQDPEDNQVVNEVIAIGDGKEKIFQLCRTYCGSKEPIFAVNADHIFRLTVNDEVQSEEAFSLTNDGRIIFKQPPGNGAVIKASFHFYYRCRFTDDIAEFENFASKLWSLKTLSFVTTL